MITRILVAYASGSGSTTEVAEAIGEVLAKADAIVDVVDVRTVKDITHYTAVVLGSSIRSGRWLPEAIQFVERNKQALAKRPVAYFTTCLTMVRANEEKRRIVLSYMEPVLALAPDVRPVGLGLFAGALDPQRALLLGVEGPQGDFRDWGLIRAWAEELRPALLGDAGAETNPMVLAEATLAFTDLSHLDLKEYDLRKANLKAATVQRSKLVKADLSQANLVGADLVEADLSEASLAWADLRRSHLQRANLERANLMGADLKLADLTKANLAQAIMNGAHLTQIKLVAANLRCADLSWADLRGADLTDADLSGANLGWANLTDAGLDGAVLDDVRYNKQTLWPLGFTPEESGAPATLAVE